MGEDGLGGDLSPPRSTLDDIDKANPFGIAWDWLQEQAANRRGRKNLERIKATGDPAPWRTTPISEDQKRENRVRIMNQNMAKVDGPMTPEEQERVQQYIQENLTSMPNMQFSEE